MSILEDGRENESAQHLARRKKTIKEINGKLVNAVILVSKRSLDRK